MSVMLKGKYCDNAVASQKQIYNFRAKNALKRHE